MLSTLLYLSHGRGSEHMASTFYGFRVGSLIPMTCPSVGTLLVTVPLLTQILGGGCCGSPSQTSPDVVFLVSLCWSQSRTRCPSTCYSPVPGPVAASLRVADP